jgi:hypothetical protein
MSCSAFEAPLAWSTSKDLMGPAVLEFFDPRNFGELLGIGGNDEFSSA